MTAPRAPASLAAHLVPPDTRLGAYTLRPYGTPDSEGRFRWRLHGPGSMGPVLRFTYTYTSAIVATVRESANHAGLDLGPSPRPEAPMLTVKANPSPHVCRIEGCNYPATVRGCCQPHYDKARHAGVRDTVCLPATPAPERTAVGAAKAKAPVAPVKPAKAAPNVSTTVPDEAVTAIRLAPGPDALPDGHPGHAIRQAIREAGAAGLRTGLEQASAMRADLTAIVTSSGVRIDGAEDLEPVEAVRRLVETLTPREPVTVPEIFAELDGIDRRRVALSARLLVLQRREAIATERAEVEAERVRAEARLRELADEEARLSA